MIVHIAPTKMDLRELAPVCIDFVTIGGLGFILTTRGLYIVHTNTLNRHRPSTSHGRRKKAA